MDEAREESPQSSQPAEDSCRAAIREQTRQLVALAGAAWIFLMGAKVVVWALMVTAFPFGENLGQFRVQIADWFSPLVGIALMGFAMWAFWAALAEDFRSVRTPILGAAVGSVALIAWYSRPKALGNSGLALPGVVGFLILWTTAVDRYWRPTSRGTEDTGAEEGPSEPEAIAAAHRASNRAQTRQLVALIGAALLALSALAGLGLMLFAITRYWDPDYTGIAGNETMRRMIRSVLIFSLCYGVYCIPLAFLAVRGFFAALECDYAALRIPVLAGVIGAVVMVDASIALRPRISELGLAWLLLASGLLAIVSRDRYWKVEAA